ncbi:MAG: bifunctional 5,10-methylenetetrahydrofolate dehydrogenase/5,10-methenyltetrahydrofolate cyclohydrolase [Phycisphaerales bacterium]|nr:bifunctional 5,10-methylenetetrahydrofolate dehydrogenase/5,10-methenyltetrahydrofolate cyclohydrolase [Phycisphaerales bacterium]
MAEGSARIIDGRRLAEDIRRAVAARVDALRRLGRPVRLDAVLATAGNADADDASRVYAENQARMCRELGIEHRLHELANLGGTGEQVAMDAIAGRVLLLSHEPAVHAIMVHLPLPESVDAFKIQSLIAPAKDVEGVNPANIGNIVYGRSSLAPCTALAVVKMIDSTGIDLRGKTVVCVGASDIVGKPIAVLLMRREATVISCNKHTPSITELTRRADVLVAAAGVAGLVKGDWLKPGAVVIDVGIHRVPGADGKPRTVGDVVFDQAAAVAGHISPVPGGVGPVTVAVLVENVVAAAERAGI